MAQFREHRLSSKQTGRADERPMVRVNGEDSRAIVRNIGTEIHDGLVNLYLHLTAPMHESSRWIIGTRIALEAAWELEDIIIPAHVTLTDVIKRQRVEGEFLVRNIQLSEGWFFVELECLEQGSHCKTP